MPQCGLILSSMFRAQSTKQLIFRRLHILQGNQTLKAAFILFQSGVHRAVVLDPSGQFLGVFSQSDMLKFLFLQCNLLFLQPIVDKELHELNLGTAGAVCVSERTSIFEVLRIFVNQNLTSVGIVDPDNVITGVISISDIKYLLKSQTYVSLGQPCSEFACRIRCQQSLEMLARQGTTLQSVRQFQFLVFHKFSFIVSSFRCTQ